jgi:hypothetical protein
LFDLGGDLGLALADHLREIVATSGEEPGDGGQNERESPRRYRTAETIQHRFESSHDELLLPPTRRRTRTQSVPATTAAILTTPSAKMKVLRFFLRILDATRQIQSSDFIYYNPA